MAAILFGADGTLNDAFGPLYQANLGAIRVSGLPNVEASCAERLPRAPVV